MPWECGCGATVQSDDDVCPSCAAPKTSWTMMREKTRTFVVSGKRVEYLRGDGAAPIAPGDAALVGHAPVEVARPLRRSAVAALAAEGRVPAPRDLLFVRLFPRTDPGRTVRLTVLFAGAEPAEHAVEARGELNAEGWVELPVAFVHGPGEGPALEGVHVIDVTEEASHAPEVEVSALGKPPRTLPLEPPGPYHLSARLLDRTGRAPVAGRTIVVEGVEARTDAEGYVHVPGQPVRDLVVEVPGEGGGQTLVPAVHHPDLVVQVRLRFVEPPEAEPAPAEPAPAEPAPAAVEAGRPAHLYPSADDDEDAEEEEDEELQEALHDHGSHGGPWYLSVQLLDATGRVPAANRVVVAAGREATSDERGCVVLDGMSASDVLMTVDGVDVLAPAVPDPAMVCRVRLRAWTATDEEVSAAQPLAQEGASAALYPAADDDEPQDEDDEEPVALHDHADDAGAGGGPWFLSAQLLDASGRVPAAGRTLVVAGREATTDDQGVVLVGGQPIGDVRLEVDGTEVLAPAVPDPAMVCRVRLRAWAATEEEARAARADRPAGDGSSARYPAAEDDEPQDEDDEEPVALHDHGSHED